MPLARVLAMSILLFDFSTLPADDSTVDYLTQIKPILLNRCSHCHGIKKQQVGLRVDSARGLFDGGDSGPAIVRGQSGNSILIHAVTGTEGVSQMPPEGDKLTDQEISLLRRWIDDGATSPADEVIDEPIKMTSNHWAFQPIQYPVPPETKSSSTLQNGIDAFIRHRLEQEHILPSNVAERSTLVRRVHFDLLGVPPTVATVREFLEDQSPDAYDRLLDQLFASPHYGERWARDWLDTARYADSNGFTRDQPRTIWKYRDWVIDAFNANLPFDEFTVEQIAGDLLSSPTTEQLVATGFHRNTLINEEGGTDPEQFRVEAVVDRVNTTGGVFLGLTIGCSQCHDHKYDPISQREYYQLFAFFNSTEFVAGDPSAPRLDVPSRDQLQSGEPQRKTEIRREIGLLEQELKVQADNIAADLSIWETTLTDDDKKKLPFNIKNAVELPAVDRSETHKRDLDGFFRGLAIAREKYPQLNAIARLRESEPNFTTTMITRESQQRRETYVHLRGDFLRRGTQVEPAIPSALLANSESGPKENRLNLAKWLVSSSNPLTARVIVNRYWQRFFGRGLVETENDFGTQGDRPTHPELLDWLASEFRDTRNRQETNLLGIASTEFKQTTIRSWDTKRLHRIVVTSATYQQSSHARMELYELDPMNKLLARQSRLRIDAEMIRDAALVTSGLLTEELGGTPVYPPQPEGVFDFTQDKKPWKTSTGRERYRKGIYTHLWRSSLYPSMAVFDFPDPNISCTRRIRSNTPLQSLTLANDETFIEFAKGFALRLIDLPLSDDSHRLSIAVEMAVGRKPTSSELARLRFYLHQQREKFENDAIAAASFSPNPGPPGTSNVETAAWVSVSRVLMNLDEFITRE